MRISSIKDKNNLLTFNQWSGGQYNNNTTDFIVKMGGTLSVSTEYSTIGETSIKSTASSGTASVDVNYIITNGEMGKHATFIFDTYSPDNTNVFLCYRDQEKNAYMSTSAILPKETSTRMTLSITIPNDAHSVFIRLSNNISTLYITNATLNIQ